MADVDKKGGVTVALDGDDLQHLLKHGDAAITKDCGPLEIKIRTAGKVRFDIVLDVPGDGAETVATGGQTDD